MSIADCITAAEQAGELDSARADIARERFKAIEQEHLDGGMTPEDAAAQAALDVTDGIERDVIDRRFREMRQMGANLRNREAVLNHLNHRGEADVADALPQFLESDHSARFMNVSSTEEALITSYNGELEALTAQHGRNMIGNVRNKAGLKNVVRELSGDDTADAAAKSIAVGVRGAMTRARRDFNGAGGNIGLLAEYDLPHSHVRERVIEVGGDVWRAEIIDRLDWSKILDKKSGHPISDTPALDAATRPKAEAYLDEIYEAIRSDGWSRREPTAATLGSSLARSRADPRSLHFKSADDWIAYNQQFGEADPFTTIMSHLRGMARDTALMRVLGPNPSAGLEFLKQTADKAIKEAQYPSLKARLRAENRVTTMGALASDMLATFDGSANNPADPATAKFFAGVRQVLTSIQLGSATLSAVSDFGTIGLQAGEFGGSGARAMARTVALYNPANKADRQLAARAGLIMDHMANVGVAQLRYTGEVTAGAMGERLSEATMRLSLLSQMTSANRMAVRMEFMGVLADNRALDWNAIDPSLRATLERRSIGAEDWDRLRALKPIHKGQGGGLLVPGHLRRADPDDEIAEVLATKFEAVMAEKIELAVPSASLRGRAQLTQGRPGSIGGELMRSATMYKSFALSIWFNQLRRRIRTQDPAARAITLAKFAAATTMFGALSLQLKEVAKGRDPQPMTGKGFWGRAAFQGGGLGIFGDLISSEQNRMGGGLASTVAGPLVGGVAGVLGPVVRGAGALGGGEDTNAGREATKFIGRNTPILSSHWATRTAYQRLFVDQLQEMLDPEAKQAQRRREKRQRREVGNSAWWSSGEWTPDRAPDLSTFLDEAPR